MKLTYYTDGGCEPNPGKGTWAFVCKYPYYEQSGYEPETTNNRMEMMAVLRAIEHAMDMHPNYRDHGVEVITDSKYVCNGFNIWMLAWAKKGWKKKGEFIKNVDLWQRLFQYRKVAKLEWVRGHNGNEYNELVDSLVRNEFSKTFGGEMCH